MNADRSVLIEVMYKADYCLPCFYMDQSVRELLPRYAGQVTYRRVDFMKGSGKQRFLELSYALFGEEAVRKYCRLAPVPSLFINGELGFDAIPPLFELEAAIEEALGRSVPETGAGDGSSRSDGNSHVHLEVLHEGPHCIPCEYMAKVVAEVAPAFGDILQWETVVLTQRQGAIRYDELARQLGRLPPVPAIFINGHLVFDTIPGPEDLRDHLAAIIHTPAP